MTKECFTCKEIKITDMFSKDCRKKDGFTYRCRECVSKYLQTDISKKAKRINSWKEQGINITHEKYNKIFIKQDGHCACCGIHQTDLPRALSVDHNHETRAIRGLLCGGCNLALGYVKDNIKTLEKMIIYLKENRNE